MLDNILDSITHNLGVVIVGVVSAFICTKIDLLLKLRNFESFWSVWIGLILLTIGFLIRAWATYYFYKHKMAVIKLKPQKTLLTRGPYKYSRNPLYLGGNVFIFFGTAIFFGTPTGVILTILHLPLVELMIRREEKQLAKTFGKHWTDYKKHVRRWI
jgi:protein-S-isoprenylcysteine O-methyltransferase Ste14